MLGAMNKECRSCTYWDGWTGVCGYAEKEGKTRIAVHGGDYRELLKDSCPDRKPLKRKRRSRHAWRDNPAIPDKMRRKQ